jgi:hypothetical protein
LVSRLEVARGEDSLVLNLSIHPSLDVLDVGGRWEVDRIAVCVDPAVVDAAELVRWEAKTW